MLSRHEVTERVRKVPRAPRSKECCVAGGRQVAGKAQSDWEGATYPGDAMTRKMSSTKSKLSSQDNNGQPGDPRRIAHRRLIIQKVNLLRGEHGAIRWAPISQEGAE